jgi:hypothetical protein
MQIRTKSFEVDTRAPGLFMKAGRFDMHAQLVPGHLALWARPLREPSAVSFFLGRLHIVCGAS